MTEAVAGMSERITIGHFGDPRREERGARIMERAVACGSLTIRTIGETRAGEIAAHRFLDCREVTVEEIITTLGERTAAACAGRRIVAVQDTTEINFRGRDQARRGLGKGGDGVGLGFFIHPVIAVDAADEAVLGLLAAEIWSRPQGPDGDQCAQRRKRDLADKESRRWLAGAVAAGQRAAAAAQVIVVGDRESDIYSVFARCPEGVALLVRAAQNRAVEGGGLLFAQPEDWAVLTRYQVAIPSRGPGDAGRSATIAVRASRVSVTRPRNGFCPDDPHQLELTLVEAAEETPPPGASAIHWRLLTTLPAETAAEAREVVNLYRLRWRIEQTFRALKSDGLGLPDVQLRDAERLFKLAAIGLGAAVRTIQLVDARDGGPRPASDVADPALIEAAEAIGPTLEGKTARQQNPHAGRSLAWLAWIAARLGGWTGYYRPPGPKVVRRGWDRLAAMVEGYQIAQRSKREHVVTDLARIP
jgi:Transposase DDE domain